MQNLERAEFDRFGCLCSRSGDDLGTLSDEDILGALGLVPLSHPTSLGAILLFRTDESVARWVPNAEFLFQDLRASDKATNERFVGLNLVGEREGLGTNRQLFAIPPDDPVGSIRPLGR